MSSRSAVERSRKTSDPPPDLDDDTAPLLPTAASPTGDEQPTHPTRADKSGSFIRLFRCSASQTVSSPPRSAGDGSVVHSSPDPDDNRTSSSTPLRSRAQSFVGSKHPSGATLTHLRTTSLPTAVKYRPSKSVSDSSYLQSSAGLCAVELDPSLERTTSSPDPAVLSLSSASGRVYLPRRNTWSCLRPARWHEVDVYERRYSLSNYRLGPDWEALSAFFAYSTSSDTSDVDTPSELGFGGVGGRIRSAVSDIGPGFGSKDPRKRAKAGVPKPERPDVLEKDGTNKLNKFWDLTNEQAEEARREFKSRERTITEYLNSPPRSPPFPLSVEDTPPQTGFRPRLAPIAEHCRALLPEFKMSSSLLTPGSRLLADQQDKQRRAQDAKEMYANIVRNAERSNTPLPPYEFLELIGKGSFGRVYKARDKRNGNLVAIKITNVEEVDFDETIRDFQKEVNTLQQLKSNKVKNVNVIHDAFDLHSQLWIVADYCTGGSIRTLLRAWEKNGRPNGLPEHYIIPIARELAIALKGMHDMQIIHRDLKGANVYITEDGDIQLGDFGVVGVIDDANSKRKTVIGTPHYMPKEFLDNLNGELKEGYGTEVDIWAYGCTIYEMATGAPPLSHLTNANDISNTLETQDIRLEGPQYSAELCDLVAYCLKKDPKARPTADATLKHPFIVNTSKQYPTSSLVKLIERFKIWEHGGGSRSSLWMAAPSDAAKGTVGDESDQAGDDDDNDDWNFSTSDDFDKRFSQMPTLQDGELSYLQAPEGAGLPPGLPPINTQDLSIAERIKREHSELSANRGERSLARVFNTDDEAGYQLTSPPMEQTPAPGFSDPPSDLPLRNFTSNAPTRESMIEIDLNEADVNETATSTFALHMDAISENTIKPAPRKFDEDDEDDYQYGQQEDASKRATMAWTFPSAEPAQPKRGTMDWSFSTAEPAQPEEPELSMDLPHFGGGDLPPSFRPGLKHTATEPLGHFRDFSHDAGSSAASPARQSVTSMIDLDMGMVDPPRHLDDPADIVRPSTASSAAGSTMTDMTSGNPFDLEEDPLQNEIDRNRFSHHKQWQSEGGRGNSYNTMQMHSHSTSLSSTSSAMDSNHVVSSNEGLGEPMPPSAVFEGGLSLSLDHDDNQWPNFSNFDTFDPNPNYLPTLADVHRMGENGFSLDHNLRANGLSSRSREPSNEPTGAEVDFPDVVPLDPNALHEDADPRLLEDEFGHVLTDLGTALVGMEHSLRQYANLDEGYEENEPTSEAESGFESSRETGTEDEGGADTFLTARRNQPRSRSPNPRQGENSH